MALLEQSINESHFIKGEELLDKRGVVEVVKINKKLLSVLIKDGQIFEVEILNINTKSQINNCDCPTFKKEKFCPHLAAALLHLRKIETKKDIPKRSVKLNHTFNLKSVLDNLNDVELRNFVKNYAQKDKSFGILLKARFARNVELIDNKVKYKTLLDTLIKPIASGKSTSSNSELRLALKVISEFEAQLRDCISLGEFEESLLIIETCLPKLHYLYSNYNQKSQKVVILLNSFNKHLKQLYEEKPAPRLLKKADEFISSLFQKSYFSYSKNIDSLYTLLLESERKSAIRELNKYLKHIIVSDSKDENQCVLTVLQIIGKHYKSISVSDEIIVQAIKYLRSLKQTELAIKYMEYFLSQRKNKKIEYALFSIYVETKNNKQISKLGSKLFVENRDIRYYRQLKKIFDSKQWASLKSEIERNIKSQNPPSSFIAQFYYSESMDKQLISHLLKERDLRHIMKFDSYFYKKDYLSIEKIYHVAIAEYLNSHAGNIALRFIEEIFSHLNQIRAYKLVTSIKNYLQKEFPHRQVMNAFS